MFYYYPKLYYKINNFDYFHVTDISIFSKINPLIETFGQTNLRTYTIIDGESPDLISNKIYGTPKYEYIILLVNRIRNFYDEWPMSYKVFNDYIEQKYGSLSYSKSNYAKYYTSDGYEISKDAWDEQVITDIDAYRKTHYEYEFELNENKTKIKLLNPALVVRFEVELQKILSDTRKVEQT